jgi:hypothetical protein
LIFLRCCGFGARLGDKESSEPLCSPHSKSVYSRVGIAENGFARLECLG